MKKFLGIVIFGLLLSGNTYSFENWEIKKVLDTWKFSKDSRSSNPNWLLIDTQA